MHAMADGAAAKSGAVNLGARLRRARLTLNMTQSDVARGQFSVSYVSAVERGQIQPSLQSLEKLATRLQVPVHHLMRDDNQEVTSAPVQRRPVENSATNQVEEVLQQAQIFLQQGMATEALETLLRFGKQMPSAVTADSRALWHGHLASTYLKLDPALKRHVVSSTWLSRWPNRRAMRNCANVCAMGRAWSPNRCISGRWHAISIRNVLRLSSVARHSIQPSVSMCSTAWATSVGSWAIIQRRPNTLSRQYNSPMNTSMPSTWEASTRQLRPRIAVWETSGALGSILSAASRRTMRPAPAV